MSRTARTSSTTHALKRLPGGHTPPGGKTLHLAITAELDRRIRIAALESNLPLRDYVAAALDAATRGGTSSLEGAVAPSIADSAARARIRQRSLEILELYRKQNQAQPESASPTTARA